MKPPLASYTSTGLRCAERSYPAWSGMRTHAHEEAGFVLVLGGTGELDYRGKTHVTSSGSLTYLPEHEPHANRFLGGLHAFELMLGEPWQERLRQVCTIEPRPLEFENAGAITIATRLLAEIRSPDALTPFAVEGLVTDLLVQATRNASIEEGRRVPAWLLRAKDYLHAHFAQELSLDSIAAEVGVHPTHLTRTFRRYYRTSVAEYVRALRVDAACRLLTTTDLSIAHIALDLGFADQGHFTRRFRERVGVTPRTFREASRNARIR